MKIEEQMSRPLQKGHLTLRGMLLPLVSARFGWPPQRNIPVLDIKALEIEIRLKQHTNLSNCKL